MTTLYLIRHAEAEGNLYRRIHGQYDSLITDNGYRQIQALRRRFEPIHIDAVYSSDLFRTMTTARGSICGPKHLPLHTRRDLREIDMGAWEDRSWAGVAMTDPEEMARFSAASPDFRAPGGESFEELRQRGAAAIRDIAARHPDQTVAVFAHGTFLRNTVACLRGLGLADMANVGHSDNTAVTCLTFDGDRMELVFLDDNSHLDGTISTLAQQHWWNKDAKRKDINLWFRPFDPKSEDDAAFYRAAREEIWTALYGSLDRCDTEGFLAEARQDALHDALWVAMSGHRPVGLLQLDPARGSRLGVGYIAFLCLIPEERRSGLGVQLIGKAVSLTRPRGWDKLALVCSERNAPALAFYERYGFQRTGVTAGAYGPLYEMEKYIGYDGWDARL